MTSISTGPSDLPGGAPAFNKPRPPLRAILVGGGRMGITHLALFNLLTEHRIRWVVVEPSLVVRWGLRTSLPLPIVEACLRDIPTSGAAFDFAVVANPTPAHATAHAQLCGIASKVFVEKPLAVPNPTPNTMCGYVLLHHPHHQRLRSQLVQAHQGKLRVSLRANTVLRHQEGWRGRESQGGGVVNEFGSHALSLIVDLAGPVSAIEIASREVVHSVDAPDRASIVGRSIRGIDFQVSLDWTDASTRKPSYSVRFERPDGTSAEHDFAEYRDGSETSSIADAESRLGSYLRGIEFTNQARHFLDNETFSESLAVAVEVDRVLGGLRDRPR